MTDGDGELPPSTRVGRAALRVADLGATVAFYRDVVGLAVLREDGEGATLGVEGTALVELRADADAPDRPGDAAGLYHVAVRLPSRGALGDALERVREHGRLEGASDHRVSEALYLADPEGNGVELYRDRPRSEWPVAADGTVRMDTLPLDRDALAAAADGGSSAPSGTDVGHVHLEVTSLPAARAFYVDALGLRVRQAWDSSALFLAAGDYHHHVGLNTWQGRSTPATGRGLAWFELVVPDAAALDDARARLRTHGADVTPVEGGIAVADPDGIAVRLVAE
ncbi:MAG: VOC family protein [Haloferacaceae archaeon]